VAPAEIVTVEGPLDDERLGWVMDLYGRADPKYRRRDVAEHLLTQSPAGPALHGFAVADGRGVGHCCVVPLPARRGDEPLRSGKLEALYLEEAHRGRPARGEPVVVSLLSQLYAFADERGIAIIHAYATPTIGRIIGFTPLDGVGEPSLVSVVSPARDSRVRGAAERTLSSGQRLARAAAGAGGMPGTVRSATVSDLDLVSASMPPPGTWTSIADDAWDWYCSSPLVRVLELSGAGGSRALVQVPGAAHEPVRLIGWRPERNGLRSALRLLAAVGRMAREIGAPTLRFQPWVSEAGDGDLRRACRLVGFVPRADLSTLWVRTPEFELARPARIAPTPLFFLGF
jgi:hypothetical protein